MRQSQSDWSLAYETLRPALRQCRWMLLYAVVLGIGARWIFLPLPFAARHALRHGWTEQPVGSFRLCGVQIHWPELALIAMGSFALLRLALTWGQKVASERAAQSAIAFLRLRMADHLMRLKLNYFDRRASGKVVLRFTGDANALRSFLAGTLVQLCADLPTIVFILVWIFIIKWQMAMLICSVFPIAFVVFRRLNPQLRTRTRLARARQSVLCGYLTQRIGMIEEIKTNRAERSEAAAGGALIDSVAQANIQRARTTGALSATSAALFTTAMGLAVWMGGRMIMAGSMTMGDFVAVLLLCTFLQGPIRRCTSANSSFQRARVALDRIHAFLKRDPEAVRAEVVAPLRVIGRRVELSDIVFRYRSSQPWVFDGLNLTMDGPGLVVLEGPTGIGKSTVLALILRLRRPQRGAVRVDGVSLRQVQVESVRQQIGWLPQEVKLVAGTVSDNVRYGCRNLTDSQVEELLDRTMGSDVPGALRLHAASHVIELGRNLSPLQRVQVALARALAPKPRILLLDNPTAHMGNAEQEMLRRLIEELRSDCLLVVASSQQWLLDEADQRVNLPQTCRRPDTRVSGCG